MFSHQLHSKKNDVNEVKLKMMMDVCYLRGLLLNAKPGGCLTPRRSSFFVSSNYTSTGDFHLAMM